VNVPLITDHESTVFCVVCVFTLQTDERCVHNRLFKANFEEKFK
jgi:hypothetical protein